MIEKQHVQSDATREIEDELRSLVQRFRDDVLSDRLEALTCFAEQGVQVEGWLKGEILAFLTEQKRSRMLLDFDREVLIGQGRRKADLTLEVQQDAEPCRIWMELKHYLIGCQKGIEYNAYGYFNDPSAGIKPDVDKLLAIPSSYRYLLILATARPSSTDWRKAIQNFNAKFSPFLRSLTDPTDFPVEFFLGLVSVDEPLNQEAGR